MRRVRPAALGASKAKSVNKGSIISLLQKVVSKSKAICVRPTMHAIQVLDFFPILLHLILATVVYSHNIIDFKPFLSTID